MQKSRERRRRKEPLLRKGGLCVLQLGDSLTQGVGEHYSYRERLAPMLSDWWEATSLLSNTGTGTGNNNNNNEDREGPPAIQYVGSQRYPCTPKLPSVPYHTHTRGGKGDSSMLLPLRHEGHCSWGSFAIRKALEEQYDNTSNAFIEMSMVATAQSHQATDEQDRHEEQQQQEKETTEREKRVGTSGGSAYEGRVISSNNSGENNEDSNKKGDGVDDGHSPSLSMQAYPCRPNVVFALMGHNDAFQIARLCKLREDQQGSVEAVRRADTKILQNTWKYEEKGKVDEGGSRSKTLFDELLSDGDDLKGSSSNGRSIFKRGNNNNRASALLQKSIACVAKHLGADNAFRSNLRAILARVAKVTPMTADRVVLWGLNPPIGFPVIDIMLRVVLFEERERLLGQLPQLRNERPLQVDSLREGRVETVVDTFTTIIVDFVSFEGFTPGVHTFDSTHPNGKGSELMAKAWLTGLKRAHHSLFLLKHTTSEETNGTPPAVDSGGGGEGREKRNGGGGSGLKFVVKVNMKAEARQRAEEAEARRLYLEQFGDGKAPQGNTNSGSSAVWVGGVGFSASLLVVALTALLLLFAFRRRLTFFARRTTRAA